MCIWDQNTFAAMLYQHSIRGYVSTMFHCVFVLQKAVCCRKFRYERSTFCLAGNWKCHDAMQIYERAELFGLKRNYTACFDIRDVSMDLSSVLPCKDPETHLFWDQVKIQFSLSCWCFFSLIPYMRIFKIFLPSQCNAKTTILTLFCSRTKNFSAGVSKDLPRNCRNFSESLVAYSKQPLDSWEFEVKQVLCLYLFIAGSLHVTKLIHAPQWKICCMNILRFLLTLQLHPTAKTSKLIAHVFVKTMRQLLFMDIAKGLTPESELRTPSQILEDAVDLQEEMSAEISKITRRNNKTSHG